MLILAIWERTLRMAQFLRNCTRTNMDMMSMLADAALLLLHTSRRGRMSSIERTDRLFEL